MNIEHAQLSMNVFDAAILGVFCLSTIVAFFRGFMREVLSLVAWVGAAVITIYLFPQTTEFTKHYVKKETLAAGSAALGTYLCALITLSLINSIIIRYLKTGAEVGIIDNVLGLVFGAIRGAFIVSLAFLIMSAVVPNESNVLGSGPPKKKYPEWMQTAITRPYLEEGAGILMKVAPGYLSDLEEIVQKQKERQQKNRENGTVDETTSEEEKAEQEFNASKENTTKAVESLTNAVGGHAEGKGNDR